LLKRNILTISVLAAMFVAGIIDNASADFIIETGETLVLAAGEPLTVDGNLTIETTGALDVSAADTNISLSGNWTKSGSFTSGTSNTVTFTDNTVISNISGNTSFYNFTCETANKQLVFEANEIQTIANILSLNGQTSGTEIKLRSSSAGTQWTFDITDSDQFVGYVDVQDGQSSTNDITAESSIDSGNADSSEASPHWIFGLAAITYPAEGKTTGTQPTIVGTAGSGDTVDIYALIGSVSTKVATVIADDNGNFWVMQSDFTAQLDTGANLLTPEAGSIFGTQININVVTSPTTDQIPTIDSPSDGNSVLGDTPTITGKGLAGQIVTLTGKDADGNLLLTEVASSTVDGSGNYTIDASDYTTSLVKGTAYLTVRVDEVQSFTIGVVFVDPYGVVFDSVSNDPIEGAVVTLYYDNDPSSSRAWIPAVVGTHIDPGDVNPMTTGADGFYSFNCITGDFRIDIAADDYRYPSAKNSFPEDRVIVIGSKGETFTVGSEIIEMDHSADPDTNLLRIEKKANKEEVSIGDIVTYTITLENISSDDVTDTYLEDKIPAGFKYLKGKAILDNIRIADPTGGRPLTFNIGTIASGEARTLKYQLIVGSGVTYGDYKNRAFAKYFNGTVISNTAVEKVEVIPDPLFDLGTVIGKVFNDRNENGIQDSPENIDGQIIIEEPIPNVQIVTEEGTIITTGKNGKYHLAGITPGRHLLRLDERTLPDEAYLTTDKVVIVDVTPGIIRKVNFGVTLPLSSGSQNIPFVIAQDRASPQLRLNVSLFNKEMIVKKGRLEERSEFRIFTNYHMFINAWKLEILEKDTKRKVKTITGTKDNIFKPIYFVSPEVHEERNYIYKLTVSGKKGKKDVTKKKEFRVQSLEDKVKDKVKTEKKKVEEYREWIEQESKINNLEIQTIDVKGETIQLSVINRQLSTIKIVKDGKVEAEIPVIKSKRLTAKNLLEGLDSESVSTQNHAEIILPKGEYEIAVQTLIDQQQTTDNTSMSAPTPETRSFVDVVDYIKNGEEGHSNEANAYSKKTFIDQQQTTDRTSMSGPAPETRPFMEVVDYIKNGEKGHFNEANAYSKKTFIDQQQTIDRTSMSGPAPEVGPLSEVNEYRKTIKVGDDYLFFVAMGDAKLGQTFNHGNIEPVKQDDKFRKGVWAEGKFAYYLKGKIKGKYLITSSFDSERDKKELFKKLDKDKYYPVYGDDSSTNYNATDTQGMLYLLIEWDKSSGIWGNYNTAFSDTEFAQFTRSLYGGKIHLETVSATRFGEPDAKLVLFKAKSQQKYAHNEFLGTGGSLYYLKNKDVIDGSENVRIEVRDKITGLVLGTNKMKEGADYEIDYSNGRITFWKPVSHMTESDSIISTHLLKGNPVYVVVDYGYEVLDNYNEGTYGGRVEKSVTDFVSMGGTYVKEEQTTNDYELKGVDTTIHLGKNMQITAEYAESKSEGMGSFISTDGGLSFTELSTNQDDEGKAYGVKGNAQLFDNKLGLSAHYKTIEQGFSTSSTSSQQGKELIGFGATYELFGNTKLTASHDIQKLLDDGNPQTRLQVGASKTETTSAQITHESNRLKLTGEYRHQEITRGKTEFESETNTEEDTIAAKANYKLTDKINVFMEQQATLKGEVNHQTTGGMEAKIFDWLSLRGAETVGTQGSATSVGAIINIKDRFSISTDYTKAAHETGETGDTASFSASGKINEKTEVNATYALTDESLGTAGSLISDSQSSGLSDRGKTHSLTLGSKRKINDIWEMTGDTTFASSKDAQTFGSSSRLIREKEGRTLEGSLTRQNSKSSNETSNTNILGLSGDINNRWAAFGTYEHGQVENHDGTDATRHACTIGFGYVDRYLESEEIRLKASNKLELRFDNGNENKRQYLYYGAVEGKINPNTTLFFKANLSQTKNTSSQKTEARYKELVFGSAYRPIDFDWLNLLAKYTYLEDFSPESQSDVNDIEAEKAHILACEAVIDLSNKWQLTEKLAYKTGKEKVAGFNFTKTSTWLFINRLGFNINENWQMAGEYRLLSQKQAEDKKHGVLFEVSRNIGDYIQFGIGYNFTEFNDDLTDLDYTSHGPFIRITGKFFDRSSKERKRGKK